MKLSFFACVIALSCAQAFAWTNEITGDEADVTTTTTQGSVLMGGGSDVGPAFEWMIDKSGGGDFVVIRYGGIGGYTDWIMGLGTLNSVETISFDGPEDAQDQAVIDKIRNAEALWMAGGDQGNYVDCWKDNAVEDAINYLIKEKKCPVGGTSAGCAIMTPIYWGATSGSWAQEDNAQEALDNPFQSGMSGIGFNDFLDPPYLENTIGDQHYYQRIRQFRHIAMMAYMHDQGHAPVKGIACCEATAVCVDENGKAIVFGLDPDSSFAIFLTQYCEGPETYQDGQPLTWMGGLKAYKVIGDNQGSPFLDLTDWETSDGNGEWQYWYVDNGTLHEEIAPGINCTVASRQLRAQAVQADFSIMPGKHNIELSVSPACLTGDNSLSRLFDLSGRHAGDFSLSKLSGAKVAARGAYVRVRSER